MAFVLSDLDAWLAPFQQLEVDSFGFEIQARGGRSASVFDRLGLLFQTGPGQIATSLLDVHFAGVGGAAVINEANWIEGAYRIFARVEHLNFMGEFLETRAFAVETSLSRDQSILARVGPLSIRNPKIEGTGKIDLSLENYFGPETDTIYLKTDEWTLSSRDPSIPLEGKIALDGTLRDGLEASAGEVEFTFNDWVGGFGDLKIRGLEGESQINWSGMSSSHWNDLMAEVEDGVQDLLREKILPHTTLKSSLQISELQLGMVAGLEQIKAEVTQRDGKEAFDAGIQWVRGNWDIWKLEDALLLLEGTLTQSTFSLSGIGNGGIPLNGEGSIQLDPDSAGPNRFLFDARFNRTPFRNSWITSDLFPDFPYVEMGGIYEGHVEGSWSSNSGLSGQGAVQVSDLSANSTSLDFDLTGGQTDVTLESLSPVRSLPGQQLSIETLRKGKVNVDNLRAVYQLTDPETLVVESVMAEIFGGTMEVGSFSMNLAEPAFELTLILADIKAEEVILLAEDFPGTLQGLLEGVIEVSWKDGQLSFGESYLELAGEEAGVLRLNLDRRTAQPGDPAFDIIKNLGSSEVAIESLRHIELEQARLDLFNSKNRESPNRIQLKGISLSVQPRAPVDITFNLRGDVEETLRQILDLIFNQT